MRGARSARRHVSAPHAAPALSADRSSSPADAGVAMRCGNKCGAPGARQSPAIASARSIRAAQCLKPGIVPIGSSAGWVRMFAAASR